MSLSTVYFRASQLAFFFLFFFSPQEPGEVRPTRFLPRVRWVGLKAAKNSSLFQPLKQNPPKHLCLSSRSGTWVTFGSQISDEVRGFSLRCSLQRLIPKHFHSYCFCGKHTGALWTQISVFSVTERESPSDLETTAAQWNIVCISIVLSSLRSALHGRPLGNWNLSVASLSHSQFLRSLRWLRTWWP